jgi:hypothetical protein
MNACPTSEDELMADCIEIGIALACRGASKIDSYPVRDAQSGLLREHLRNTLITSAAWRLPT